MPEVGIGFKLHGDASEFEKAVSKAKKSVEELHHEVRGLNQVTRLGKEIAAGFGLYEAFNKALETAKKLREESEKNGTSLDKSVAAAARLADALEHVKTNAATVGAKVVGGISGFFEKIGDKLRGGNGDLTQVHEDEERAEAAKKVRERGEAERKKIEAEKEKDALAAAKGEEKIKLLRAENAKLDEEGAKYSKLSAEYQDAEYQVEKNRAEITKILVEQSKAAAESAAKEAAQRKKIADEIARAKEEQSKKIAEQSTRVGEAQANLDEAKANRGRASLQELASVGQFQSGVSQDARDAGEKARNALDLEQQAGEKRKAGDVSGANELFSKADDIRSSLGGTVKDADAHPFGQLEEELKKQTDKLEEVVTELKGKFKSQ